MDKDKISEFLTVLIFALTIGMAIWLVIVYLDGIAQVIAFAVIIAATLAAWQYLRSRFSRD